ncbi:DUF2799 domain-containing protein [Vibrio plantisponsor]|uniref:DUF2799 domain-containing protein n=1 Tax=Vibrio plantisponsor TaxID=664643 RepID=A0ABU4ICM1_9VIBR|nr:MULTISPECIES: DUF2799 domain-containing protein [Vibrio]MDW6016206.1 DUF2799 domain-containing protein [Vibrio plantisponsor]NNM41162.1 DUF2799 domain-containing protein [Vibrio plantisponsor]PNH92509.1 hypothetical protein C1M59_10495 [Vibrio diazotrophicus]
MKKTITVVMVLGLLGCAATDSELAKEGNWYQIGYQDGMVGHSQRSYKILSELGDVQESDYENGYSQGITEYCNPNVAYQIGVNGQYYEGVCEGTDQAQRFRMEWQRGWNEYNN